MLERFRPLPGQARQWLIGSLPGVIRHGPRDRRRLAFTFDDGPCELTSAYLDVLAHYSVPATFFLMGDLCEAQPSAVFPYVAAAHQVASHGYDHRRFPSLSWEELDRQLQATEDVLGGQVTGTPWVRPPYGAINARVLWHLARRGFVTALWSYDSLDYSARDAQAVIDRCAPQRLRSGDVLLFHEGQKETLAALPTIIDCLLRDGYELVTMADLVTP